jgi:hypothetical protein
MSDTTAAPTPDEATPVIPTDAAGLASRDAELTALAEKDAPAYYYKDDGALAREHLAIRKAQQGKSGEPADASKPTQADQPADDDIEVDAIDLNSPVADADDDGEEGEHAEAAEPGLEYDREDFTYTPPEGAEVTEVGQERIDAFAEFAHKSNMAPEVFEASIGWYNNLVQQEQARLAEADKTARTELATGLKIELGDGYAAFKGEVDTAFRELPQDLRTALRSARLPDGRLLLSMPEAVHMVHALSRHQSQTTTQPRSGRSAMQQELAEIDALMHRDIDEYHKPWRTTGMSASQRRLQIAREMASEGPAKPSASDLRAEMRDLEQLKARDIQTFMYGSWPGARSPADRLHQLQMGRG